MCWKELSRFQIYLTQKKCRCAFRPSNLFCIVVLEICIFPPYWSILDLYPIYFTRERECTFPSPQSTMPTEKTAGWVLKNMWMHSIFLLIPRGNKFLLKSNSKLKWAVVLNQQILRFKILGRQHLDPSLFCHWLSLLFKYQL